MADDMETAADADEAVHLEAESRMETFKLVQPAEDAFVRGKAAVALGRTDLFKSYVQVLKGGGENNLHFHTKIDSFWYVLKGHVRFYGPNDKLVADLGVGEGVVTPRGARYWFESVGEEQAELLQVSSYLQDGKPGNGRVSVAPMQHPPRPLE